MYDVFITVRTDVQLGVQLSLCYQKLRTCTIYGAWYTDHKGLALVLGIACTFYLTRNIHLNLFPFSLIPVDDHDVVCVHTVQIFNSWLCSTQALVVNHMQSYCHSLFATKL